MKTNKERQKNVGEEFSLACVVKICFTLTQKYKKNQTKYNKLKNFFELKFSQKCTFPSKKCIISSNISIISESSENELQKVHFDNFHNLSISELFGRKTGK